MGDSANGANTSSVGSGVGGSDVLGDRANGANTFSVGRGVDDGGGDMTMGLGENSEVNSGRGIGLSGGLGRPREAGAGAGRAQGARAGSLEELMATILRDAGLRGDRQAGGWGSAWRDDVSARSDKFVKRCRQLCHERPGDRPAALSLAKWQGGGKLCVLTALNACEQCLLIVRRRNSKNGVNPRSQALGSASGQLGVKPSSAVGFGTIGARGFRFAVREAKGL